MDLLDDACVEHRRRGFLDEGFLMRGAFGSSNHARLTGLSEPKLSPISCTVNVPRAQQMSFSTYSRPSLNGASASACAVAKAAAKSRPSWTSRIPLHARRPPVALSRTGKPIFSAAIFRASSTVSSDLAPTAWSGTPALFRRTDFAVALSPVEAMTAGDGPTTGQAAVTARSRQSGRSRLRSRSPDGSPRAPQIGAVEDNLGDVAW